MLLLTNCILIIDISVYLYPFVFKMQFFTVHEWRVGEGEGGNLYGCKFPIHNRIANGYKLFYRTFLPSSFLNLSTLLLSLMVISLYATDSNPGMHLSFQIALSCLLASENNVHFPSAFFPIHLTSKGRISLFSTPLLPSSRLPITLFTFPFHFTYFGRQSKRTIYFLHACYLMSFVLN